MRDKKPLRGRHFGRNARNAVPATSIAREDSILAHSHIAHDKLNEKDRSRVLDLIVAELKATDHPLIVWSHDEKLRARRGGGASHFHCVLGHVSPTTDLALDMRNHVQRLQKAAAIAAFEIEGQTSVSSYHHSIVTHLIRQGAIAESW
jgi:hypothetical protein